MGGVVGVPDDTVGVGADVPWWGPLWGPRWGCGGQFAARGPEFADRVGEPQRLAVEVHCKLLSY